LNRKSTLAKRIRGLFLTLLLLSGALFLLYRLFHYHQARAGFPFDTTIAGLDVGGLTADEAGQLLREQYLAPVAVYHGEERIELNPADVGFNLEVPMRWSPKRRKLCRAQLLAWLRHPPDGFQLAADPGSTAGWLRSGTARRNAGDHCQLPRRPGAAATDPLRNGHV
jgi:hypothetical protein